MAMRRSIKTALSIPISAIRIRSPTPSLKFCSTSIRKDDDGYLSDITSDIRAKIILASEKPCNLHIVPEILRPTISTLASRLLSLPRQAPDLDADVARVMDSGNASALLHLSRDGAAFVDLLDRLKLNPHLALNVVDWRRKQSGTELFRLQAEEYTKAIALAGRAGNLDYAAQLFAAAASDGLLVTSTYNALMAVYMYNGISKKTLSVFEDLKKDHRCEPTVVTYNILLSVFGRSFLVDHMETVLQVVRASKLDFNISTYNTLIAAYITAQKWDKMESTFEELNQGVLQPDSYTHLLMLRGYAHSGNLEKMEAIYELIKDEVHTNVIMLRVMICAYCKRTYPRRVAKIEELLEHIPKEQYRSWLNINLIKLYAQEGLVEKMDRSILEAFTHNTTVNTVDIMLKIVTSYFRSNAVDKLTEFVKRAESAGWKICRSLYHCRMVLYGRQQRFTEMQLVTSEMESIQLHPCRKTYLILYKVFSDNGKKSEANRVLGLMWKLGFNCPIISPESTSGNFGMAQ